MGHQEVRLPTSLGSGKVQPHSIRQIRETGLGEREKKNRRVGTDESIGGKGQISWEGGARIKSENMDFQEKREEKRYSTHYVHELPVKI